MISACRPETGGNRQKLSFRRAAVRRRRACGAWASKCCLPVVRQTEFHTTVAGASSVPRLWTARPHNEYTGTSRSKYPPMKIFAGGRRAGCRVFGSDGAAGLGLANPRPPNRNHLAIENRYSRPPPHGDGPPSLELCLRYNTTIPIQIRTLRGQVFLRQHEGDRMPFAFRRRTRRPPRPG